METNTREHDDNNEPPNLDAGITEAAKELVAYSPRLLSLQRALSVGAAGAQEREAKRLAKKYGTDHPRVAEARARAASLGASGKHVQDGVTYVTKAIEPLFTQNLFAGYVVDAKGDAAVGHVVRLRERGDKGAELHGKTGKDGYFKIALGGPKGARRDPLQSLAVNLARFIPANSAPPPAAAKAGAVKTKRETAKAAAARAAAGKTDDTKSGAATPNDPKPNGPKERREFDVSIVDPAGSVVHEEELPLRVASGQSTFRYFVLSGTNPKTSVKGDAKGDGKAAHRVKG